LRLSGDWFWAKTGDFKKEIIVNPKMKNFAIWGFMENLFVD
jgi:hypothetical protein